MRRHPVLGYSRMHRGIDFAAPRGTPIYAAGDGVIESAGRNGGYGKYVRIRHNSTYKTAYGHMSRIAKRARRGKRVRQGQVIGFVGSTGRSTGPHLHYEVLRQGRQVNPLKIKLPSGEKLKGKALESFHVRRERIDALRELARQGDSLMARAGCLLPAAGAGAPDGGAC
jgi:murein DD-endopeptidase MepM/ murein hydrolase activator NlpD